jgi:hypothetical protein
LSLLLTFLVKVVFGVVRDHDWLLIHQLLSLVCISSVDLLVVLFLVVVVVLLGLVGVVVSSTVVVVVVVEVVLVLVLVVGVNLLLGVSLVVSGRLLLLVVSVKGLWLVASIFFIRVVEELALSLVFSHFAFYISNCWLSCFWLLS